MQVHPPIVFGASLNRLRSVGTGLDDFHITTGRIGTIHNFHSGFVAWACWPRQRGTLL
ncbi:hypothetical protein [Cupriavidus sp.]|uniref:hypothetical protein n=1 Tax=Cupriavidus sp. TaxID=1873897 RepID=UPI003D0966F8